MSELRLNRIEDKDTNKGVNVDALHYQNTQLVKNLGEWQAGLVFNEETDYAMFNDVPYKPAKHTTLPYTTQGSDPTVAPDAGIVVPFVDLSVRNLGDYTDYVFDSVSDALNSTILTAGDKITAYGRYQKNGGGGGQWIVVPSSGVSVNTTSILISNALPDLALALQETSPTIKQLGALADETTDILPIITEGLSNFDTVCVSSGGYYCSDTVEIENNKQVILGNNAVVTKYAALTTNSSPVFWLKGDFAKLTGLNFSTSRIISERKSSDGVILIGHRSMTESHANVNYCTLSGVRISGAKAYGQTDTSVDKCLTIQNPQFSGLTSYFHTIKDLLIENANVGMEFRGWANGIMGGNIHGFRLGNETAGVSAFLWVRGGLDNSMTDFFFHRSANSTGLIMDELDNTANGGVVHTPSYNSLKGLVFEQGGSTALGVDGRAGVSNYIEARTNSAGGDEYSDDFKRLNVLVGNRSISANVLSADDLRPKSITKRESSNGWVVSQSTSTALLNMVENTSYKLIDVELTSDRSSATVNITHNCQTSNFDKSGGGSVQYVLSRFNGVVSSHVSYNHGYEGAIPNISQTSGSTVTISFACPDNGTGTAGHNGVFDIDLVGRKDSRFNYTVYDSLNVVTGTSPAPKS
ncbi:hypothetical protein [Salinivibrio phage CW02]|uniref:Uncharacterized protein n=1 Tax=Salinivibrio phage CW02 TaxID=1161935 RepID=H9D1H8_9CAUD|nr:hypothetical protein F490_gp17 [Salinivibrio phage CW02]AFE86220.1 hypothetical protein [Salinivibrio phage CW02]